jgi:predicted transposase YbfD/YdcC
MMYLFNFKLKWKGLQSLILVENERVNKATNEKAIEKRYYISSLKYDAAKIASITRKHWSIENNLHWCLDVGFREDECIKNRTVVLIITSNKILQNLLQYSANAS